MLLLLILAAIGFCASLYSFFIERKLKQDASYKPKCDISDRISCTKPLMSIYSTTIGVSNAIWGMVFYVTIFGMTLLGLHQLVFLLSIAAIFVTVWLAYILYFKIKTLCLVCSIIYIINIGLLVVSFFKYMGT
jgi:vitamin-K-epoxide reductase (warfarin-sensitive)